MLQNVGYVGTVHLASPSQLKVSILKNATGEINMSCTAQQVAGQSCCYHGCGLALQTRTICAQLDSKLCAQALAIFRSICALLLFQKHLFS